LNSDTNIRMISLFDNEEVTMPYYLLTISTGEFQNLANNS